MESNGVLLTHTWTEDISAPRPEPAGAHTRLQLGQAQPRVVVHGVAATLGDELPHQLPLLAQPVALRLGLFTEIRLHGQQLPGLAQLHLQLSNLLITITYGL